MNAIIDPLVDPSPEEVPLKDAPLVRVIVQVRFPEVLSVEQREFVAPFQEAIRGAYPVLRQEQTQGLMIGPAGVAPAKPKIAWRFVDVDEHWRVSLTPDALALETTKYQSRDDFFARLHVLLTALDAHIEPKLVDRLGVRYIDRVTGPQVDDIAKLVRRELLGITGSTVAQHAKHSLTETMFEVDSDRMVARWGTVPPGATVDPAAIEPLDDRSWILDLDMFSGAAAPFEVDHVLNDAKRYAERIYAFFRWAVTDDFLSTYGGTP